MQQDVDVGVLNEALKTEEDLIKRKNEGKEEEGN